MFAVPFGRVFWKEYRVHRSLWLSCLALAVVFQFGLACAYSDGNGRGAVLDTLTVWFPAMYAVGCGALLFASEREERTCEWLLALDAPPAATLSAKLAFGLSSTIALQLVLATFSVFLTRDPDWMMYLPVGLIVMIWSILGSIVSRRVLISIPAMLFWCVVTVAWPIFLLQYVYWLTFGEPLTLAKDNRWLPGSVCLAIAAFVAGDVWLGWRWCQGQYLDGTILEGISKRIDEWRKRRSRESSTPVRIPQRVEYEQSWRRNWQRLTWQERHGESQDSLWLLLVSLSGLGISVALGGRLQGESLTSISLVAGLAIPVSVGVMAFRTDIHRQQSRFLLNRGISPVALWLAKQIVWLPRAFWVSGIVFLVSLCFEFLFVEDKGRPLDVPLRQFLIACRHRPDQVIWFILLSYGCGQLSAILFHRVILSIAAAVALNIACALWQAGAESLRLPQWWSLGLPLACLFGVTFWQMRGWLLEDHSRARQTRLIVALAATPGLLLVALAWHRIDEARIPISNLYGSDVEQLWNASRIAQLRPMSLEEESTLQRFASAMGPLGTSEVPVDQLDKIVDFLKQAIPPASHSQRWRVPASLSDLSGFHTALRQQAEQRIQSNELALAFEYLRASLRLARCSAGSAPVDQWYFATNQQRLTLDSIVALAGHPLQDEAEIDAIKHAVENELNLFPPVSEAAVATFLRDSAMLIERSITPTFDELIHVNENRYIHPSVQWSIIDLPWERQRLRLLLTEESQLAFRIAKSTEEVCRVYGAFRPYHEASQPLPEATDIALAESTTPLGGSTSSPQRHVVLRIYDRATIVRAALIRLTLLAYRKTHGRSPNRLIELVDRIEGNQLIDPFSGRLFEYYPSLLVSEGPKGLHFEPVESTYVKLETDNDPAPADYVRLELLMSSNLDQQELEELKMLRSSEQIFRIPAMTSANTNP